MSTTTGSVDGLTCLEYMRCLISEELQHDLPDLVIISISLGIIEESLTNKAHQSWPAEFKGTQKKSLATFVKFADSLLPKLDALKHIEIRSKVKAIADAVWANLTGAYSNSVHHVQHLFTFTKILDSPKGQGKRQLDCASVVLATLVTCHYLAHHHKEHAHLGMCKLQVSEDHCWINYLPDGDREGTVEVTTDTAANRGKIITEAAWQGWLYTGGHAVLCSPKMAITALVASLNPSIVARQNTGTDSEALQQLQHDLLKVIHKQHPQAMYPAALCTLADLVEINSHDRAEKAILAAQQDEAVVDALRDNNEAHSFGSQQDMFVEAIETSKQEILGGGRAWYPYSFVMGYLLRRAKSLLNDKINPHRGAATLRYTEELIQEALKWSDSKHGASVLQIYRFSNTDGELYKDVEGVWESMCEAMTALQKAGAGSSADQICLLQPLLEFWDGICCCWQAKPKPSPWVNLLLRTVKLFSAECRQDASDAAQVKSQAMVQVRGMWKALKPAQIKPHFETADIDSERATKRSRAV